MMDKDKKNTSIDYNTQQSEAFKLHQYKLYQDVWGLYCLIPKPTKDFRMMVRIMIGTYDNEWHW